MSVEFACICLSRLHLFQYWTIGSFRCITSTQCCFDQERAKMNSVGILLCWSNNHDFDSMQPKYIHSMTPSQQRHRNSQRESYWRLPHLMCWHLYAESCSATRAVKGWLQWSKRCVKYSTNGVLLRFLRSSTWWLLFFGVYNLFVGWCVWLTKFTKSI
jgi:hypothetical protein